MFSKLNHLAITTDNYGQMGLFYRAILNLKASGDIAREQNAISVGDGYVGMTLIPRRAGRKGGLDHFGIEVADMDVVRDRIARLYPDVGIAKRPGNRPFASFSSHDPAGNYFDLSQPGHENRAEVYAKEAWTQDTVFTGFGIRVREPERVAKFYVDVFQLDARNAATEEGGYQLTDGRMTMHILPWKISAFDGAGIEQPGMDHIGFRVPSLETFKNNLAKVTKQNLQLWPRPIDIDSEGEARLSLLRKAGTGEYHLADPDGTLIAISAG